MIAYLALKIGKGKVNEKMSDSARERRKARQELYEWLGKEAEDCGLVAELMQKHSCNEADIERSCEFNGMSRAYLKVQEKMKEER